MKQLLLALAVSVMVGSASAQGTSEAFIDASPTGGAIFSTTSGWSFTPTTDMVVTDIGCLSEVLAFNGVDVQVGLWSDIGPTLLQSVTITGTNTLVNITLYSSIDPLYIMAGSVYRIGIYSSVKGLALNFVDGGPAPTMGAEVSLGASATSPSGFAFPSTLSQAGTMILGANFQYRPVPEPAGLLLAGLGGLLLLLPRRKQ